MRMWFVWHANPWFIRGTNFPHGTDAGVFAFDNTNGHANGNVSFRVVHTYYVNEKISFLLRKKPKWEHRRIIPFPWKKHINNK